MRWAVPADLDPLGAGLVTVVAYLDGGAARADLMTRAGSPPDGAAVAQWLARPMPMRGARTRRGVEAHTW
ncbi:MAG: hypothetical protein R3E68_12170 [Burkholderiaceae bacterium]